MLNLISTLLLLTSPTHAEFNLQTSLAEPDRRSVLRTLGLGTLSKSISQPQALGTDSGVEFSLSTEIISTSDISEFIADPDSQQRILYPKINLGKGIFDRLDLFFHFIPYTKTLGLSEFGGFVRYHYFKDNQSPLTSSLIVHANSSNFNNQLISRNTGADLSLGLHWQHFAVSSNFGWATSTGRFTGGTSGVTDTNNNEKATVDSFHFSIGGHWNYDGYLFSAALDHYTSPVYSVKIGYQL